MTRPSTSQADKLLAYLASQDWKKERKRLEDAIRRNKISSARDGFPSGGDGGVSGGDRPDPTYTAAMSRDPKDLLDEHVKAAIHHLKTADKSIRDFKSRMDAIDRLSDDKDLNPEPGCWAMARIGHWEPVHRSSDVGGRLREAKPLGRWAYDFVWAMGRVPTPEECRARAEGRRVRLKAS